MAPIRTVNTAAVVRVEQRGPDQALWLDRSAFYPTTGGQPFDTGTVNAFRVNEVIEEGDEVAVIPPVSSG